MQPRGCWRGLLPAWAPGSAALPFPIWPAGCAPAKAALSMPSVPSPVGISWLETLITPSLFHEFTAWQPQPARALWQARPQQRGLLGMAAGHSALHSFTQTLLRARQSGAAGLGSARPWAQGAGCLGSGGCLQPPVPLTVPSCLSQARLDGGRQQWRPVLMAVTEKDLLLYDGMPWTRDAWASPCHSYPLVATRWAGGGGLDPSACILQGPAPLGRIQLLRSCLGSASCRSRGKDPKVQRAAWCWHSAGTAVVPLTPSPSVPAPLSRLVHSGSGRRSPSMGSELTFATRTGSRQGVEMHVFRVETHRDLSSWTRVLVQGCHAAAELVKEVTVGEFCGVGGTPGAPLFPPGALGCRQGEGAAGPGLPGGGLAGGGG